MNRNPYYDFRKKVAPRAAAAALRYDPQSDEAPEILATGHGLRAEEILRLAGEHNVPLHQDAALVEALARLDATDVLPRELYAVVAEVLAYIFRLDEQVHADQAGR
ncbi:MAG: EscU/YscU/HrcU family type III secretion system export apparatus switch protein [Candidatus Eremiobacteraeota bacterium]|nr:EscU/YscU/HrcU family type III secretion system export apparatus switch protein [Candidatus Eremiobacteraeota bacterium]